MTERFATFRYCHIRRCQDDKQNELESDLFKVTVKTKDGWTHMGQ